MTRSPAFLWVLLLAACAAQPEKPISPELVQPVEKACVCEPSDTLPPLQIPDAERYVPAPVAVKPGEPPKGPEFGLLRQAEWSVLSGFEQDNLAAAWPALRQSCTVLKKQEMWRSACEAVMQLATPTTDAARNLLREQFTPYQVVNPDGSDTGLVTGYYEPLLKGSRVRSERYRYPLYSKPDDLVTVDLGGIYPELAYRRLRGRLDGNRLTPYYSRGEIEVVQSPLSGKELLWVDDVVDLFFLQIQGSGIIKLDSGDSVRAAYAEQNGQPYQSIGKVLIDRGELTADKASMQGIKEWGRRNPEKLRDLLNSNPSYVFFRELPSNGSGPPGALGVPLTAERSIAVDPRYVPLGAPVFLSTTYPNNGGKPLRRLVLAQDTGGAIKGAVRADFFWGTGMEAGRQAGAMKQRDSRMWVLLPKNWVFNSK
jgi:membrane-bound lytic murein transglycosylase A